MRTPTDASRRLFSLQAINRQFTPSVGTQNSLAVKRRDDSFRLTTAITRAVPLLRNPCRAVPCHICTRLFEALSHHNLLEFLSQTSRSTNIVNGDFSVKTFRMHYTAI